MLCIFAIVFINCNTCTYQASYISTRTWCTPHHMCFRVTLQSKPMRGYFYPNHNSVRTCSTDQLSRINKTCRHRQIAIKFKSLAGKSGGRLQIQWLTISCGADRRNKIAWKTANWIKGWQIYNDCSYLVQNNSNPIMDIFFEKIETHYCLENSLLSWNVIFIYYRHICESPFWIVPAQVWLLCNES